MNKAVDDKGTNVMITHAFLKAFARKNKYFKKE